MTRMKNGYLQCRKNGNYLSCPWIAKKDKATWLRCSTVLILLLPAGKLMMESVKECITDVVSEISFDEMINVSHNHALMEHHFGKNVMAHRKGTAKAYDGQLGIIPGSQGTTSGSVAKLMQNVIIPFL